MGTELVREDIVCEQCNIPLKHFERCPQCGSMAYHLTKSTYKEDGD